MSSILFLFLVLVSTLLRRRFVESSLNLNKKALRLRKTQRLSLKLNYYAEDKFTLPYRK